MCVSCCCCQITSVVSASVRPYGQQPTRLLCPQDSLGKNTGVGCHFLLPDVPLFIHLLLKEFLGLFPFEATMNKSAILQMFVFRVPYGPSFQLIRRILRSTIVVSCGENMLSFVETANCLPKQLCHFAPPPAMNKRARCSTVLAGTRCCQCFRFSRSSRLE